MKCVVCNRVKGKRHCPAKGSEICSACCGEKRVVEINCPQDCPHLVSGHGYQAAKKYTAEWEQGDDPRKNARLYATAQQYWPVIGLIEQAIVRFTEGVRSFSDDYIREAVSLVLDTYKTEQKGIIYEHHSSNPLVQGLIRELRAALEELRQPSEDRPVLKTTEIVDCLEVVHTDVAYHIKNHAEVGAYLTFVRRSHPGVGQPARPQSGLIYP